MTNEQVKSELMVRFGKMVDEMLQGYTNFSYADVILEGVTTVDDEEHTVRISLGIEDLHNVPTVYAFNKNTTAVDLHTPLDDELEERVVLSQPIEDIKKPDIDPMLAMLIDLVGESRAYVIRECANDYIQEEVMSKILKYAIAGIVSNLADPDNMNDLELCLEDSAEDINDVITDCCADTAIDLFVIDYVEKHPGTLSNILVKKDKNETR